MNAHRNYHDNSGFTQCSNLRPCFFLFQLIVRASSRKNEARPRVSQTNPKSDKEPPPSTTSRPPPQPLRNAITLNTLCQRSESVPRSEKQKSTMLGSLALFQSASSSDTPAQKTYHTDGHQHELHNLVGVRSTSTSNSRFIWSPVCFGNV